MRHLALDVGDERIGVALSDETGTLASPLEIIPREAGPSSYLRLAEIIAQQQVGLIVVGFPLREDGQPGKQVRSTEAYVAGLKRHIQVPIVYWDERHTSSAAREMLAADGRRRRRHLDDLAATVILQDYLDAQER